MGYSWIEICIRLYGRRCRHEDALKAYLNVVMAFNPQITLDTTNAKLGRTSSQNYAAIWSAMN
jgi:hypothetical protein